MHSLVVTRRVLAVGVAGCTALMLAGCGGSSHQAARTALPFGLTATEAAHLRAYDVRTMNMAHTLQAGDVVGADSSITVKRGDIVVFREPTSWALGSGQPPGKVIFRVLAIGGDHIQCCDSRGGIVVNGKPINEPYLYEQPQPGPAFTFDVRVPTGRLFVLGDNRLGSADSRAHMRDHLGTVPIANVLGVVTRILKPSARATQLKH